MRIRLTVKFDSKGVAPVLRANVSSLGLSEPSGRSALGSLLTPTGPSLMSSPLDPAFHKARFAKLDPLGHLGRDGPRPLLGSGSTETLGTSRHCG
jgi:hypothetical protein